MDKTEIVETVKSTDFKHTLVKIAVSAAAAAFARKIAEELVDRAYNRRQVTVPETVTE